MARSHFNFSDPDNIANQPFLLSPRIDNEIHDTLMRRSVSSDEEQVLRASQRSPTLSQETTGKRLLSPSMTEVAQAGSDKA